MLTRDDRQKRNVAIAQALAAPTADAGAVGQQYGLSRAQTYRAASQGRELLAFAGGQGRPATGRSASQVNLYSELGRSGLRRFGGLIDDDYDRSFKTLTRRVALYREMGDDAIVASVLHAVKMTIKRVSWRTQTDGKTDADKKAAEWLETCMHDMSQSWSDSIDQALGMLQYGFYPAELVYKKRNGPRKLSLPAEAKQGAPSPAAGSKYDDGKIGWRKWVFMAPETLSPGDEWVFDETGGLQGLNQTPPPTWQKTFIPIQKALLFRTTSERGNPEGRALLRPMYWSWYLGHNLEEIEAITAERAGAGFPVVYLGADTTRENIPGSDLDAFTQVVASVKADEQMGLVIPYAKMGAGAVDGEGALFEFVSPPSKGPVDTNMVITRHQQSLAMVGLAQFIHLGMHGTGARAQNESSQDFFTLAVSGWADLLADTINRFAVDRLFAVNQFPGLTAIPTVAHEAVSQTDLVQLSTYINLLVGKQLITPSEELERYLLSVADLPESQTVAQNWARREAAAEARAKAQSQAAPAPDSAQGDPSISDTAEMVEGSHMKADPELLAVLRAATRAIDQARLAERQR